MAHDHDVGAPVGAGDLGRLGRLGPHQALGSGEALGREEAGPVIDHLDPPAQPGAGGHQGNGVVAGAADHQAQGRLEHLDQGPHGRRPQLVRLAGPAGQTLEPLFTGDLVEVGVAQTALGAPVGVHDQAGAEVAVEDGDQGQRPVLPTRPPGGRRPMPGRWRPAPPAPR